MFRRTSHCYTLTLLIRTTPISPSKHAACPIPANSSFRVGSTAVVWKHGASNLMIRVMAPAATSQSLTVRSPQPEWRGAVHQGSRLVRRRTQCDLTNCACHTLTVWSSEPDASMPPHGLHDTQPTQSASVAKQHTHSSRCSCLPLPHTRLMCPCSHQAATWAQ
jgi:hypothetical protein